MLSRVADSLYWMARYLERAEHTARMLDTHLHLMLDQQPTNAAAQVHRLLDSLNLEEEKDARTDPADVARLLTTDRDSLASIVRCVGAARENARQVRDSISSEMWEQLNLLHLHVARIRFEDIWSSSRAEFLRSVREGSHLFDGITDSTLSHGEGWEFIQLGRYLERAWMTAALLDAHRDYYLSAQGAIEAPADYLDGITLLRSTASFEAFCRRHTANLQPGRVAEFLLLDPEFPHTLRFCLDRVSDALDSLAARAPHRELSAVRDMSATARAMLQFHTLSEMRHLDFRSFLGSVKSFGWKVHDAINAAFIAYPIDVELMTAGVSRENVMRPSAELLSMVQEQR